MMTRISGCLALMIYAHNALASSGGSHGINWWHLGSDYKDSPALGWLTITFFIFVVAVARAVKKPLSLHLEARSNDIRQQIEEGRLAKLESERKLKLYDEKLASLGQEIEKMRQDFIAQAIAEKADRERQALETERRILLDADDTIRANFSRVKNRLAEEAIARATVLAEQAIAKDKHAEVESMLRVNFLHDLHDTAADVKRGYVVNELIKSSAVKSERGASAGEVH